MSHIILLTDWDCWICKQYGMYVTLKQHHNLEIKDARKEKALVTELLNKGFDINNGVIAIIDDKIYQGKEAVRNVEQLSHDEWFFKKFIWWLIQSPLFHIAYYLMTKVRIVLLKLEGKDAVIRSKQSDKS